MGKLIIFTAPSGSGKTTIVRHLLQQFDSLAFSVSATTRPPRPGEVHGKDYYFLAPGEFREKIEQGAFAEWEEVYPARFYGTLNVEIEKRWAEGKDVIFDIDTQGALALKAAYPDRSLAVFIRPPSMDILKSRLTKRKTERPDELEDRLRKAIQEMEYQDRFDRVLVNDKLDTALLQAEQITREFLQGVHPPRPDSKTNRG